ncbi:MAG: AtpZ/AtpI family protein [Syntrophaceae bacterium]
MKRTLQVKRNTNRTENFYQLAMLNFWGAALVAASFLCLFVGHWIDVQLDTPPLFMIGMLVLVVFLVVGRLYREATKIARTMGDMRKRHA